MARFMDVIKRFRSLSPDEEKRLDALEWYVSDDEKRIIRGFVKDGSVVIDLENVSVGGLLPSMTVPKIIAKKPLVSDLVAKLNSKIDSKTSSVLFKEFSKVIYDNCSKIIAPDIVGFDMVKKAVALQLFSPEKIHILLLGDPGTGKTRILSSVTELALVSAMGLGSGTSGVGLSVTVKGKDVKKGLLPLADGGICAIDELNLMKEESRASLYNAMQNGFVTYDKGGHSYRFDARVSVLATANPKGDKFTGNTVAELKKQLPFDPALLSRFHLTFFIRKHSVEEFKEISRSLLKQKKVRLSDKEISFIKEYLKKAHDISPSIPKKFEQEIVDFIGDIKEKEAGYLVEVSPRMVVGFSRLTKAAARMELRSQVQAKDIRLVKDIVSTSLTIR